MIKHTVTRTAVLVLTMIVFSACGSSGSDTGSGAASGGTTTTDSDEAVNVVNAIGTTALTNAISISGGAQANVQAQFLGGKTVSIASCTWYDAAGTALDMSDAQALLDGLDDVVNMVCESSCTEGGTESISVSNTSGTELFSSNAFDGGVVLAITYDSCPVTNACGTNTLDGTLTITATDVGSNPCDATLSIVSSSMTIDGAAPPATCDMTFNITAAGDCGTVSTFDCDAMLDDNSTMFDGATSYDKDAICDMIDNPSC